MCINGYQITSDFTSENAGLSRWAFCEKNGREFFIKEFQSPVYPEESSDLSPRIIERKRSICENFYRTKSELYGLLKKCRTGNVVLIQDFFRSGPRYYAVTERIHSKTINTSIVANLGVEQKMTLMKSILYSMAILHKEGIVHADIKPDNLLLKETVDGFFAAKIIDFDAAFLINHQPKDIQGDFLYFAPETFLKMRGEERRLTGKIDVFALGILFYQYWVGAYPNFSGHYQYAFEAVLNNEEIPQKEQIPDIVFELICQMLSKEPEQRPTASEVLSVMGVKVDNSQGTISRVRKSRGF